LVLPARYLPQWPFEWGGLAVRCQHGPARERCRVTSVSCSCRDHRRMLLCTGALFRDVRDPARCGDMPRFSTSHCRTVSPSLLAASLSLHFVWVFRTFAVGIPWQRRSSSARPRLNRAPSCGRSCRSVLPSSHVGLRRTARAGARLGSCSSACRRARTHARACTDLELR